MLTKLKVFQLLVLLILICIVSARYDCSTKLSDDSTFECCNLTNLDPTTIQTCDMRFKMKIDENKSEFDKKAKEICVSDCYFKMYNILSEDDTINKTGIAMQMEEEFPGDTKAVEFMLMALEKCNNLSSFNMQNWPEESEYKEKCSTKAINLLVCLNIVTVQSCPDEHWHNEIRHCAAARPHMRKCVLNPLKV